MKPPQQIETQKQCSSNCTVHWTDVANIARLYHAARPKARRCSACQHSTNRSQFLADYSFACDHSVYPAALRSASAALYGTGQGKSEVQLEHLVLPDACATAAHKQGIQDQQESSTITPPAREVLSVLSEVRDDIQVIT